MISATRFHAKMPAARADGAEMMKPPDKPRGKPKKQSGKPKVPANKRLAQQTRKLLGKHYAGKYRSR
jgi:hypothetical protein